LSKNRGPLTILGANTIAHYENEDLVAQERYKNSFRAKVISGLRTILRGSHYLLEKYITNAYIDKAFDLIARNPSSLLICSCLVSADIVRRGHFPNPVVILTQNDEVAWFRQMRRNEINPLGKMAAHISVKWLMCFLQKHADDYTFAHITESDSVAYGKYMPGHKRLVVPAGVDVYPLTIIPEWDGKIRLLFCGSLSAKMNNDALLNFAGVYWPALEKCLGGRLEVWVAGSHPTIVVRRLCAKYMWNLYFDLPDDVLRDLYRRATFSILPFAYTAGTKIKLLNSLAAGLPVLATANMKYLPEQDFEPNLYSDDPEDWCEHLVRFVQEGVQSNDRALCQKFISRYSWQSIAFEMDQKLREANL